MGIRLAELLAKVPEQVEETVKDTQAEALDILQRAMRNECRLVMRTPEEQEYGLPGARVPVQVVPGYPECLRGLEFPEELARILLLSRHRRMLEECLSGNSGLVAVRDELLRRVEPADRAAALEAHATALADWAAGCLRLLDSVDPLRPIFEYSEDILGVYRYELERVPGDDRVPNSARIELYWCVIGLVADNFGCEVKDLTVVVLAHELGHAYTQVGADIQGRRWLASAFRHADVHIKEGLAQYLCERVLARVGHRYPSARPAFDQLLRRQSSPYTFHRNAMANCTPEAVRSALLEIRRNRIGDKQQFVDRLGRAAGELG